MNCYYCCRQALDWSEEPIKSKCCFCKHSYVEDIWFELMCDLKKCDFELDESWTQEEMEEVLEDD